MIKVVLNIIFLFFMLFSVPGYAYVIQCEITKAGNGQKISRIPFTINSSSSKITLHDKVTVRINGGSPLRFSTREVDSGTIRFTDSDANLDLTPKGNNKFEVDSWSYTGGGLFLDAFPHMSVAGLCSTKKKITVVNKPKTNNSTVSETSEARNETSDLSMVSENSNQLSVTNSSKVEENKAEANAFKPHDDFEKSRQEEIKLRVQAKKFNLFNNPGKEIESLLLKDQVLEAYYVFYFNQDFFEIKSSFTGKLNSEKYGPAIKKLASLHFRLDVQRIVSFSKKAQQLVKKSTDSPDVWPAVRQIYEFRDEIKNQFEADNAYQTLVGETNEYWEFLEIADRLSTSYGSNHFNLRTIIDSYQKYGFTLGKDFFVLYPSNISIANQQRVITEAAQKKYDEGTLTLEMVHEYPSLYKFAEKLKAKEQVSSLLGDKNRPLKELLQAEGSWNTLSFLSKVFDTRGITVQVLSKVRNFGLDIKCLKSTCATKSDADIKIIIVQEAGNSSTKQVGTYNTSVSVKSGTRVVPNPRYQSLAREIDLISQKIYHQQRQEQIHQQTYYPQSYESTCTPSFGNQVKCTTTQAPNDYEIGARGGRALGQALASVFGQETLEDRYRNLSRQLSQTSPNISKNDYRTQQVSIPEIRLSKNSKLMVHVFDVANKQHLHFSLPLDNSEVLLVPTNSSVFNLPLNKSVKNRLVTDASLAAKMIEEQNLDLFRVIFDNKKNLNELEYIDPDAFLELAKVKVQLDEKNIENLANNIHVKSKSETNLNYFELLGNEEFITWAKSSPVRARLLQGFIENNAVAIEVLRNKWMMRQQ